MNTAKVFKSGNSQAVRLPKEFQFEGKEVYIKKMGRAVVLIPKNDPWLLFKESLNEFPEDFFAGERQQPPLDHREGF
jgi:antitoxin VapB